MSNNKQTIKLYTEEELINYLRNHSDIITRYDLQNIPFIELPSDEGIRKIMELDDMEFDEFDPYHVSHLEGAKWMRDKIQGGNNEQ